MVVAHAHTAPDGERFVLASGAERYSKQKYLDAEVRSYRVYTRTGEVQKDTLLICTGEVQTERYDHTNLLLEEEKG